MQYHTRRREIWLYIGMLCLPTALGLRPRAYGRITAVPIYSRISRLLM